MELCLYSTLLERFELKANNIEISLNGNLLTQQRNKNVNRVIMLIVVVYVTQSIQAYCFLFT